MDLLLPTEIASCCLQVQTEEVWLGLSWVSFIAVSLSVAAFPWPHVILQSNTDNGNSSTKDSDTVTYECECILKTVSYRRIFHTQMGHNVSNSLEGKVMLNRRKAEIKLMLLSRTLPLKCWWKFNEFSLDLQCKYTWFWSSHYSSWLTSAQSLSTVTVAETLVVKASKSFFRTSTFVCSQDTSVEGIFKIFFVTACIFPPCVLQLTDFSSLR